MHLSKCKYSHTESGPTSVLQPQQHLFLYLKQALGLKISSVPPNDNSAIKPQW